MDGLLDFSFNVHRLLVKNLDPFPVDLMAGFGLVFPDCGRCLRLVLAQRLRNIYPLCNIKGFQNIG